MVDNDYFVFARGPHERSDNDYTHGTFLHATVAAGRNRVTRLLCDARSACALALVFGQEMYTPNEVGPGGAPLDGERPYAGWLFGSAQLRAVRAGRALGVGLILGGTGPSARADDAQFELHRRVPGFRVPEGWEHQLSNEIAFAATASAERLGAVGSREEWSAEIIPRVSAHLGTLRTSVGAGVAVRAGWGLRHPWVQQPASIYGLYVRGSIGSEMVGHSLFLDGNTYRESISVPKTSPVREWERGVGVRMLKLLVEYTVTSHSREYPNAMRVHSYGRISVIWLN